jgi:hypothetical protein
MPALLLHRIGPKGTNHWPEAWRKAVPTWASLGASVFEYHDEDLMRIVEQAFPALSSRVAKMRTVIERTDICRLAIMHLFGGIYADLDQQLVDVRRMRALVQSGRVYLPFEKGRLVGQAILIGPPRHPLWAAVATAMVNRYDPNCYETLNTGPDKLTVLWNEVCIDKADVLRGVSLHAGLDGGKGIDGSIVRHLRSGEWKKRMNLETHLRKRGELGCAFHRVNVTCFTRDDAVTRLTIPVQLRGVMLVNKPHESVTFHPGARTKYTYGDAMSINGLRLPAGGGTAFVARLCDPHCIKGPPKSLRASTVAIGQVACRMGQACQWRSSREVYVDLAFPPGRTHLNGPEDARIDVTSDGRLFALANVPAGPECAGNTWAAYKLRQMAYIPLDLNGNGTAARACRIQIKKMDRCRREKNWASLVHRGRIFMVYSLVPFQMLELHPASCSATLVAGGDVADPSSRTLSAPDLKLRGSTRYVHGLSVPEGELYWSVVHVQAGCQPYKGSTLCEYTHHIAVVLAKPRNEFVYLGILPDVALGNADFKTALTSSGFGKVGRALKFGYIHSITSFVDDGLSNHADIGFHVDDSTNFQGRLYGLTSHLALHYTQARLKAPLSSADATVHGDVRGPPNSEMPFPSAPTTADIAMISDFTTADPHKRSPPKWLAVANRAKACYAQQHGYAFYSTVRDRYSEEERGFVEPPVKQKTRLVRYYLARHKWVFWLDYDALIMNPSVPLSVLTDRAADFDVIAADGGDEVNAGVFAVRNSRGGYAFLASYERDAERAAAQGGHLPWRDNGYLMHAVLRGIVQDRTVYRDECFHAGVTGSKGKFKRCMWRMRKLHDGFPEAWIDGPPRKARPAQRANWTSGATYRVYMSNEGVMNNLLDWNGPNRYQPGDLVLHIAGPNKSRLDRHLVAARRTCAPSPREPERYRNSGVATARRMGSGDQTGRRERQHLPITPRDRTDRRPAHRSSVGSLR